jgi:hypothetical protein
MPQGVIHKFLKPKESKKRRGYARDDAWEMEHHAAGGHANFVEVTQGKELAC